VRIIERRLLVRITTRIDKAIDYLYLSIEVTRGYLFLLKPKLLEVIFLYSGGKLLEVIFYTRAEVPFFFFFFFFFFFLFGWGVQN
jgi:hypothetical protein